VEMVGRLDTEKKISDAIVVEVDILTNDTQSRKTIWADAGNMA
jgi:hypothetical protein